MGGVVLGMGRMLMLIILNAVCSIVAAQKGADWPVYASSNNSTKYSLASQVNAANFKSLTTVWRWSSIDQPLLDADASLHTWKNESTPLKIGDILYTSTSLSQVAAINAVTGAKLWQYNPGTYKNGIPPNYGFLNRGLAYRQNGKQKQLYIATGDAYLIALDANTGKPVMTFGDSGRIDLGKGLDRRLYGCTSPPLVCGNVVVVGSSILDYPAISPMPPGDVRAFDATTGELLWVFRSVPNVWTWMSCDEKAGIVYLPFGTPTNDFYGGQRPGDGLYGECIVAVDVKTGKKLWHYQTVHHGLWDYDLPAAPVLADVMIDHHKRKILVQVTKQGFVFVLDRLTGEPVWPIEEKPVPASHTPGEHAAATQPFPSKPLPFERQGIDTSDVINPRALDGYDYGTLFTPPSEKGTITLPGNIGGASWSGAALDPVAGLLYIPSVTQPAVLRLFPVDTGYKGYFDLNEFTGPGGTPLLKPPHGRVTAINLHTGAHAWVKALENDRPSRIHILLTKTLLLAACEGGTPSLKAFNPQTGELVGEVPLPANATGAPITYSVNNKQYILMPVGGASQKAELVALALP